MSVMMSAPKRLTRSEPKIEPQVIRTVGTGLLAAFVVVLVVSITTIGWHGTGAYASVMRTLMASLLILMAAALLIGRLLAKVQPETAEDTSPSSELKRLRDQVVILTDTIVKLRGDAAKAEPTKQPDKRAEP
ncbi:MAG: hypothetical protein ABW022_13400 [Actinoplanes sp.]